MEINTIKGSYYVYLPTKLYSKIVELSEENEHIDLGLSAFLLHLIIKGKFKDKELENGSEWVNLCSGILRKYDCETYKTSCHLKFLKEKGIIDSLPYIKNIKGKKDECAKHKITEQYLTSKNETVSANDSKIFMQEYEVKNKQVVKQNQKRINQRKGVAQYKTEHLTKWLNSSGFSLDIVSASKYVDKKYSTTNDLAKKKKRRITKKIKRLIAINEFKSLNSKYFRDGKDDRLHSYFTSLPSDLKRFVTYEGQRLKEADIKSSQPFILTIILGIIKDEYYYEITKFKQISEKRFSNRLIKRISSLINTYEDGEYILDIRGICYNITIMLQETLKPFDFTEIDSFISLIHSKDIYTYVGEHLLESGAIWFKSNKFFTILFDKEKKAHRIYDFDDLRKCAKKITINALYASPKNSGVKALQDFKMLFPEVTKLLDVMKKNNKAELPILMQRIEAKCILDYCSKKISKKHPETLLISRHDSLVTTEDKFEVMRNALNALLNNYFGIDVELGEELWE
ncbi:hypothetical protein AB3G33_02920 [Flavobacterium sp. WC2421]|uniref:hypothetical protein n=1 Tax=unclassified Flavobacterium TaxID=196869 RepID=UPI0034667552